MALPSPIQQGRVVAVDLNTGHLTGFQFLGAGTTPGDLNNRGGGVWNALATDGTAVYFTTGNGRLPWCVWPYTNCAPNYAPPGKEPQPNNGLSMIRVNKDTGTIDWKFNTVDFNHDGDPDWAAGAAVMSASCGKLIASVQKDGWAYAVDADSADPRGTMRWQFPPTIERPGQRLSGAACRHSGANGRN
jgi:outer membrane protein assembly factor BamB